MNPSHAIALLLIYLLSSIVSSQQKTLKIPQTFGLITVTYARRGDNTEFEKFLNRYAPMDCPIVTEMNIVWNNPKTPEEMGVYRNSATWKRPINFFLTPSNSMNWRYKIPKQSKVQVYFSIDDDIQVNCEQLTRGFGIWQANAIGQIGPIVSYGPRVFEYTQQRGFQYAQRPLKDYFSIGLVGLAFMSRHFLQLYYADLWELQEMRKVVTEKNNCDDIGINWMIQYFYPELQTIIITGNLKNISPAIAQSTSSTHYPYRSQCVGLFTDIFGINALRYKPLVEKYPSLKDKRMIPLKQKTVLAKKEYLEIQVLHTRDKKWGNFQNIASIVLPHSENSQQIQPTTEDLEKQLKEAHEAQIDLIFTKDELKSKVQKCEQSLAQIKKIGQSQKSITPPSPPKAQKQENDSSAAESFSHNLTLLVAVAVGVLVIYKTKSFLNRKSLSSSRQHHVALPVSDESAQIIVISSPEQ